MKKISRKIKRAQERKQQQQKAKLMKQLQLSDFEYSNDDKNVTFSAVGPHLIDFINVLGLSGLFKKHVTIDKRRSLYSSDKISTLMILQNILGYDRIEGSHILDQDSVLKDKLGIENYPDPKTFRDELKKYTQDNIEELLLVNRKLLDIVCTLSEPQYVDLHFDSKVITVYGDQEKAEVGYNPHKQGRKSYELKVCTVEPFGIILAIHLGPGNSVSSTDFIPFYQKCRDAVPQDHLVIRNVRLDRGFFSNENINAFEADFLSFEVVAKQYKSIKQWIKDYIHEEEFIPFYPGHTIDGASFSYCLDSWEKPRDFVVIRKVDKYSENGQGVLFPRVRYQVICHNQLDMTPKEVWEDYNKRARIELNIRDLDYDHFITKVPTGYFLSNFAYFWHCVLSYNVALIFKNFILPEQWAKVRTSTLRKKLINIPGRLVNHSGKMVMRLIQGFPYIEALEYVKERLLWLYQILYPLPAEQL